MEHSALVRAACGGGQRPRGGAGLTSPVKETFPLGPHPLRREVWPLPPKGIGDLLYLGLKTLRKHVQVISVMTRNFSEATLKIAVPSESSKTHSALTSDVCHLGVNCI